MSVLEYLEKTYDERKDWQIRNSVICKDGYYVSIQGGTETHYCSPRTKCNIYDELELGFPSSLDDELRPYAETQNTCDTVFGYVPISVVEDIIEKHGGIIGVIGKI